MNARQAKFVQEYLIDLNATQAAIRAGYSAKTAEQGAAQLLRNIKIKEAIDAALSLRAKDLGITAERVLGRLMRLSERGEELEQISAAIKAEELLGKHVGMWPAKLEHTGPNGGPLQMITGSVVVDIKDLGERARNQLRGILLAAKAKEQ